MKALFRMKLNKYQNKTILKLGNISNRFLMRQRILLSDRFLCEATGVLLSMPFSFIGAFLAILITGKTLNIFTFIGLILLMGLVKKNAILLVDYTNTLRAS